jgi:hypothetical protein
MDNIDDTAIKLLIHRVGLKHHLVDSIINKVVNSPYKFTKETIAALDIDKVKSKEDFNDLKTNFLYKYIGKLHSSHAAICNHRSRSKKLIEYHKLNKENNE